MSDPVPFRSRPSRRPEPSLSEWLALRQPADHAARSTALTQLIVDRLRAIRPLRVLDLGTGTGSNIRYLSSALGGDQCWVAVDKDANLLAEAAARSTSSSVQIETRALNLGLLDAPEIFDGCHLVTASALLDLVSEQWLQWVAEQCRRVGACALFTITYNGRNECTPVDPDDGTVFELFNRHQATDKGLGGPAVGPRGTDVARQYFEQAGFDVRVEPSDWQIGRYEREFQRQLIGGWASAAREMTSEGARIDAWLERRLDHVAAGRSRIVVGHDDLAAYLPAHPGIGKGGP